MEQSKRVDEREKQQAAAAASDHRDTLSAYYQAKPSQELQAELSETFQKRVSSVRSESG